MKNRECFRFSSESDFHLPRFVAYTYVLNYVQVLSCGNIQFVLNV